MWFITFKNTMASLEEQFRKYRDKKLGKLRLAAAILLGEQQNIIAEDTYRLEDSIIMGPIIQESPLRYKIEVGSFGVFYAAIVEYGVQGRIFNYHRYEGGGRPTVYVGVGQAWRQRSLENARPQIINTLQS